MKSERPFPVRRSPRWVPGDPETIPSEILETPEVRRYFEAWRGWGLQAAADQGGLTIGEIAALLTRSINSPLRRCYCDDRDTVRRAVQRFSEEPDVDDLRRVLPLAIQADRATELLRLVLPSARKADEDLDHEGIGPVELRGILDEVETFLKTIDAPVAAAVEKPCEAAYVLKQGGKPS